MYGLGTEVWPGLTRFGFGRNIHGQSAQKEVYYSMIGLLSTIVRVTPEYGLQGGNRVQLAGSFSVGMLQQTASFLLGSIWQDTGLAPRLSGRRRSFEAVIFLNASICGLPAHLCRTSFCECHFRVGCFHTLHIR